LIGPPVGGVLYSRFGFRGPFIFGIAVTVIDLIGRLFIIERKEALIWGVDPTVLPASDAETEAEKETPNTEATPGSSPENIIQASENPEHKDVLAESQPTSAGLASPNEQKPKPLSLLAVMIKLSKSSRALVAIIITLIYG
jgi:DHA1 family solute carrier family 18 vesicular amine transporter 1/2